MHLARAVKKLPPCEPVNEQMDDTSIVPKSRPRSGPCYFGHVRTTLRNHRGKPVWSVIPESFTSELPCSTVVCQACSAALRTGKAPKQPSSRASETSGKADMIDQPVPGPAVGGPVGDQINQHQQPSDRCGSKNPESEPAPNYDTACIQHCAPTSEYHLVTGSVLGPCSAENFVTDYKPSLCSTQSFP